jgi:uncharacterized protein YcfL
MTEATTTTAAPPAKRYSPIWGYISAGASLILAAVALIRFFDTSLPGCLSTTANTTIQSILRDKNVTGGTLSDKRELSKSDTEIRCAARMSTPDGARHDMTYRIFRGDDGKTMVAAEWRRL